METQRDNSVPKIFIEGFQTVTSTTVTEPRQTRRVLLGGKVTVGSGIFQRCLNMIQYYLKGKDETADSGWVLAGWIKETLGKALLEQPMICGRLRKSEGNEGELEIVSNDSGTRLIEARIQMELSEFLDLKNRDEAEAQLVFWKDIDEQNPHFSPLFYVQVTNFQCGGYAIGISCSIFLADILLNSKFLQTWTKIHNDIIKKNKDQKAPLFYLPVVKNNTTSSSVINLISSNSTKNSGSITMIFNVNAETKSPDNEWCRKLGLVCLKEAENKLGIETMGGQDFCLVVNESFESIKLESCSRNTINGMSETEVKKTFNFSYAKWDDLQANQVSFRQGMKPDHVSNWFRSVSGGVCVVILIPSVDEEDTNKVKIIVSIPNQKF